MKYMIEQSVYVTGNENDISYEADIRLEKLIIMKVSLTNININVALLTLIFAVINSIESTDINPHDYNFIINHPELCGQNDTQRITLLLMVFSAPHKFAERMAIRNSWGLTANRHDIKRLFLLAQPSDDIVEQNIIEEDIIYGDIIQEDFNDAYRNLTLKSIMMIKWATIYCPQAQFLLKIDDDCFLNPYNLFKVMNNITNVDRPLITGQIFRRGSPHRNKNSKWYISKEEYPAVKYPDFASGPAYLYTRATFPLLYNTTLKLKTISLEDVYLNGMCRTEAKIPLFDGQGFTFGGKLTACNVYKSAVTYHDLSPHWHFPMLWWAIHEHRIDHCQSHNSQIKKIDSLIKKDHLNR